MERVSIAAVLAAVIAFTACHGRTASLYAAAQSTQAQTEQNSQANQPEKPAGKPATTRGGEVYARRCAICHGEQREGILPGFPPLTGIDRQMNDKQITDLIHTGKGRMPGFPKLVDGDLNELLRYLATDEPSATAEAGPNSSESASSAGQTSELAEHGRVLFRQNCAFCHGRDAMGGETGPDLTRSKLVNQDVGGNKVSPVILNGRPEKKMPAFHFSNQQLLSVVAFIHEAETKAASKKGGRRGVDVADLQTGNAEAGKQYFNGAGTCSRCHSATGDLAGVATRYEGLQLERHMLYPHDAKSRVTVTLPSGKQISGTLAYQDEFTVGLRDADGSYHSWPVSRVRYKVDSRIDAHAELFSRYTDADIHNLMAYLQTLR